MRNIARWIGLTLVLVVGLLSQAQSATFYLSNCATNRAMQPAAGCVAGSASNDGLTAATPKAAWSEFSAAQRSKGNRFCWARGSVSDGVSINLYIANSTKGDSVEFCAYDPPWLSIPNATVTIDAGSGSTPFVVNWTGHGLAADSEVSFTTTGALPYGLEAGRTYFVLAAGMTANSFRISMGRGQEPVVVPARSWGGSVAVSIAQSGTHTARSAPRPVLYQCTLNARMFTIDDSQTAAPLRDGGYKFTDINAQGCGVVTGTSTGAAGGSFFYTANIVHDVEVWNTEMGGFANAVYSNAAPHTIRGVKTVHKGLRVRSNYIHDSRGSAILGNASYLVWEKNFDDRNGQGQDGKQHSIYLGSVYNATIRGNFIRRSSTNTDIDLRCDGTAVVIHGVAKNLVFQGNSIVQEFGAKPTCYAIEVDPGYGEWNSPSFNDYRYNGEEFARVLIDGNYIKDVGYVGISTQACKGCVVQNNVLVWTSDLGPGFNGMAGGNPIAGKDKIGGAQIWRHNTIYINTSSVAVNNPTCFKKPAADGTGHSVYGNLCVFGPAVTAANATCWTLNGSVQSDYDMWNWNACWAMNGTAKYSDVSATFAARPAWMDANGLYADPLLITSPLSGAVQSGSPVINAASDANCPRTAAGHYKRVDCDIGAEEFNKSIRVPYAPTVLRQ